MPSFGHRCLLVPALLVACLSVVALPGLAQVGEVPDELLKKEGAWTAEESQLMRQFVAGPMAAMQGDDPAAIVEGRGKLLEVMRELGVTPSFLRQYYRLLAEQLPVVMGDGVPIGQVNALVVAEFIPDAAILPMIRGALAGENAGVRFAAARTLVKLLPNPGLNLGEAAMGQLVEALADQAEREPDAYVADKLLDAIAESDVPNKRELLIRVLKARVDLHADNPGLSLQPEFVNMQELFIKGLGQFNNADTREFVLTAARYLRLVAHQLNDRLLPAGVIAEAENVVRQADTVLQELGSELLRLDPINRPPRVDRALATDNYGELVELAEQWVSLLQEAKPGFQPFNADDLDVKLPGGEAGAAPAEVASDR